MDAMIHHGYSKANALLKGYKRSREGITNYWELRRNWKYLYYKKQNLEFKPATFLSEQGYHSNSQRLM
jgi:hypothetical protein